MAKQTLRVTPSSKRRGTSKGLAPLPLLLTGGSGLIGSRIIELIHDKYELSSIDRSPLEDSLDSLAESIVADITDKEEIEELVKRTNPDWLLHLAAITDVEGVESKVEIRKLAWRVNVEGTKIIANLAENLNIPVVYFSTDHVFNGEAGPYTEEDYPDPLNEYGKTKLAGEKAVKENTSEYLIIRLAYPYRAYFEKKSDTVRWMMEKLKVGEEIRLVTDQVITPTFIDDLSQSLDVLIQNNARGVYHVAGTERLSFYQMGLQVAEVFGFDKKLVKETTLTALMSQLGRKAPQPRQGGLKIDKLRKEFGLEMSSFKDSLVEIKKQQVRKNS